MRRAATVAAASFGCLGFASAAAGMTLTSPDIKPGAAIAEEQANSSEGCAGGNVSPALAWIGAPSGTKSFAVSLYDPDAPGGGGFWHWWVVNLPAETKSLPKGAGSGTGLPAGAIQPRNDFGKLGYGGPCPPSGKPHRYRFTVYALDIEKIPIDANASPGSAGLAVNSHALAKATLSGLYGR